jgi:CubicO group peptidase (beta-lactamase class C family)
MKRGILFSTAPALVVAGRAQTRDQAADPVSVAQRIERIEMGLLPPVLVRGQPVRKTPLAERMAAKQVPGLSVAVIHNGTLEWARGFGVTKIGGPPVTVDTLFQAASISKPLTALAVLHLVQAGKLDLDADVNRYLKTWKIPPNPYIAPAPVTLRELLSHTAGMTIHGFNGYEAGAPRPTLRQVLEGTPPANNSPIEMGWTAGTSWRYSGGGYVVVQQVLQDVTGQAFPDLMQATVLDPIGMTHSSYLQPLPAAQLAEAATPYRPGGEPVAGGPHVYPEMAAAGLWTTPSDLARYLLEVQKSLVGGANHVLSAAMTRQMLAPGWHHQGLGPEVGGGAGRPYFDHSGANEGYRCEFVAYQAGDGVVVMTNSDNGREVAEQVIAAIAYEYGWPDFRPPERTVVPMDPAAFAALVGRYQLSSGPICAITRVGDQLFTQLPGQPRVRLFPMGEREFSLTVVDARVTFAPAVAGQSPAMVLHQSGRDVPGKRVE